MRFGWRERYESRGSRTVLRGAGGEIPRSTHLKTTIFLGAFSNHSN